MKRSPTGEREIGPLLLIAALIFGAWLRIFPAWRAGFPINDGGMFYRMVLEIQANHYALPAFTAYNHLSIPFAYPPLAFYIGAGLGDLFSVPPLEVIRWLPGIVNTLCIAAFYFLSREILTDRLKSGMATLLFAVTPHMGMWLSMGGGLTRSFGMLFLILTLRQSHRLFSATFFSWRDIFWSAIWGGLTLLSHPESSVFAVVLSIYIWFVKSRSGKGFLQGVLVSLGVTVMISPWLYSVTVAHGMEPFLSAFQTGGRSLLSFLRMVNFDLLTEEKYIDIVGAMGLFGLVFLLARREYFLPAMFALIYFVQPRSAHTVANLPLAMAAGVFVFDVLLPAWTGGRPGVSSRRWANGWMAVLGPLLLFNLLYSVHVLSLNHLTGDDLEALAWVRENTPAGSRFLVLTGESDSMCDSLAEWFPALSDRASVATLQGREWILSGRFGEFLSHRNSMQMCLHGNLDCLERESGYFGGDIEYILVSLYRPVQHCSNPGLPQFSPPISIALQDSGPYEVVYRNETNMVFRLR